MKRQSKVLVVIAILLTGCQSSISALDQAATMVAETVAAAPPTNQPLPTPTPWPDETPKPFPTVTHNAPLTATLEALNVLFEVEADAGSNSETPYEEGYLAWKQSEPATIEMTGPQSTGKQQRIGDAIHAANFVFKSDVTWEASGVLLCGLTYRAEEDLAKGKQYQFYFYRISGLPAYKIDFFDLGHFKNTITDVKFSDGVNDWNGSSNELVLAVQDNQFTVYINGKRQGQFFDSSKQRADGLLAFLGWQDSGKGSCTFENSWLWVFD